MATHPKALRISSWTAALVGLGVLAFVTYGRFGIPPRPIEPFKCDPMPPHIAKLGPASLVRNPATLPELKEDGWPELRLKLTSGDVVRSYETQVTGGHLAMRGHCYLGQTLAWIR